MSVRFRGFSKEELETMLKDLVRQQVSGIASISINGEMTTFSTPEKIEKAIVALENEIQRLEDIEQNRKRHKINVFYPTGGKGWL